MMATRTRRRPRRVPLTERAMDSLRVSSGKWVQFTWGTDTQPVFGARFLPHVATNWIIAIGLVYGWVTHWATWWQPLAGTTVAGLIYTMGRAMRQIPARRKAADAIVAGTRETFKHPNGTQSAPVDPFSRVLVQTWAGAGKLRAGAVLFTAGSPAATSHGRVSAERALETVLAPHLSAGHAAVFTHRQDRVEFTVVDAESAAVLRQNTRREVEAVLHQLLPTKRGQAPTRVEVKFLAEDGASAPDVPTQIVVDTGGNNTADPRFRESVEKQFDARIDRGVVFVYEWATGLRIHAAEPGSPEAVRKTAARKICDTTVTTVSQVARTAEKNTVAQVTSWLPEDAQRGANTPTQIQVSMGTADFSAPWQQQSLERSMDRALEQIWPDRVWLAQWSFGAETVLELNAVPTDHEQALRKRELNRLRTVVQDKFPVNKNQTPPDVDVHDWTTITLPTGTGTAVVARATEATVTFGTVDVTRPETRMAFELHFDSLTNTNDWRYEWNAPRGLVNVTAVPVLRDLVPFPEPGTKEFNEWNSAFREGKIYIGPAKGGYRPVIDLNTVPHVLIGGSTGAGKSVLLTLFLFGALMNPDIYELVVIDPKVTDFTWTGGYPNVLTYAPTDARESTQQIQEAIRLCHDRMTSRQNLIGMIPAVRNLHDLRRKIQDGTIDSMGVDGVPKRLLVFFDEGSSAFTPSKDPDRKAVQGESRTDMENIGMLGRAMEVNIVMAAQKPSNDNIGTAIRDQLGTRIAVGFLNTNTSEQVLGNTLANKLLSKQDPKGRGIVVDETGRELVFQCYWLPDDTDEISDPSDPDGPPVKVTGVRQRVADRLKTDGWESIIETVQMTRIPEDGPDKGKPITFETEQEKWVHHSRIEP